MKLRSLRRAHPPWLAARFLLAAICSAPWISLPLAAAAQSLMPVSARVQGGAEASLILLEVRLDGHLLSDSFGAYQEGGDVLLPLGELARLLTLAITVHPGRGSASGFVIREEREFSVDVDHAAAVVEGRPTSFEPRHAAVIGDDLYVSSRLLAHWLPVDLEIDLSKLQLDIRPRERLPLQERLDREDRGRRLRGADTELRDPGYPHVTTPFAMAGVPFVDQTFGADANLGGGRRDYKASYTGYFTGDLLGMEGAAYVSSRRQSYVLGTRDSSSPDVRLTLSRHDPDGGLLGPMQARSVAIGSIAVPSVTNVMIGSPNGYGAAASNRPLDQPTSFDRQNLRGNLPPGWDVTLYYNDALLAYQQARADGQYAFDDLPLSFGPNEFRLVFNGPLGQLRVEKSSFLLDHSIIKPGEVFYSLAGQRADGGRLRTVALVDVGLTRAVAVNGALVTKPNLRTGADMGYAQTGLRAYLEWGIVSSQVTLAQGGGALVEIDGKTRIAGYSIDLMHTQRLGAFESDVLDNASNAIRFRDLLRVNGTSTVAGLPPLTLAFEALRDQLDGGGQRINVAGRVSTMIKGTAASNTLTWHDDNGSSTTQGNLQLGRRVLDVGLNAQIGYSIRPRAAIQAASLTADRSLGEAYRLNLGIQRTWSSPSTLAWVGLTKNLGRFGLGLNASYSSQHQVAVGMQLFIALGREPRGGEWTVDAQPLAGTGAVSARAFVDRNLNGVHDPGEELIANAGFIFNGGGRHPSRTDGTGTNFIGRLVPGQYSDIALDPATLEDPQWKPLTPGVRVLPRPGVVDILEFAVVATSEIDGTVYLLDKSGRREIGDARIELVDGNGLVVAWARSSPDGYYLLHQVTPGRYSLRIAPDQAAKLGLGGVLERPLTVPADGDFINGQDFELKATPR